MSDQTDEPTEQGVHINDLVTGAFQKIRWIIIFEKIGIQSANNLGVREVFIGQAFVDIWADKKVGNDGFVFGQLFD